MADRVSEAVRSYTMSRIRGRNTQIELVFRRALWAAGLRYRVYARMKGTPDVVIPRAQTVIFLDSCFWHGCRWHCRRPKSNVEFWEAKFRRNRVRDRAVMRYYKRRGWKVLRFWEHRLMRDPTGCVATVLLVAGAAEKA